MLENGYVTLPRSLAKKEWFCEGNTLKLYITLLFNVAFKDTETGGVAVKKGQFLTSFRRLAAMSNISEQQVRTAIKHLQASGDITLQVTSKFSIVTLNSAFSETPPTQSDNTRVNTCVDTASNTRSSKVTEEKGNKEKSKEEESREAAPPSDCSCDINISLITREELSAKYGEDTVARYEKKFSQWASGKPFVNAKLYPTIAKWMAEDIPHAPKSLPPSYSSKSSVTHAPQSTRSPKKGSSVNTEELRKRIMESYRNNSYVNI